MIRAHEGNIDTTLTPPGTQYGATQGKPGQKTSLDIGDLQLCASPCNAYCLTRNEQVSGSGPLIGSLFSCKLGKNGKPLMLVSGASSAVRQR